MVSTQFREFSLRLVEVLAGRWRPPDNREFRRAVVQVKLRRDGELAWAKIARRSGDIEHDAEALAVVKASGFPPLPPGVSETAVFAFNFDSRDKGPEEQGAGVPVKGGPPSRETGAEMEL